MNNKNILYIILVIILILLLCDREIYITEHITDIIDNTYIYLPIYRYIQPWWNSTRHTRNMSYDIRGDIH